MGWNSLATLPLLQVSGEPDSNVWAGWGSVILVCGVVFLVFAIAALFLWQGMKDGRERMMFEVSNERDDLFRKLADRATASQEQFAETQLQITREIADMRQRIAAMEKMMKEVG